MYRYFALLLIILVLPSCSKEPSAQPVQQTPVVQSPVSKEEANNIKFNRLKPVPLSTYKNPKF